MKSGQKRGLHILGMILGLIITIAYSYFILRGVNRQYQLQFAPEVPAKVAIRQVTVNGKEEPFVQLHYAVAGKSYDSDVYRYGIDTEFPPAWFKAHHNGEMITVRHDSHDPSIAVVSPGLDSRDITQLMVCLALFLGTLWVITDWLRNRLNDSRLGSILVETKKNVTRFRLVWHSPLDAFLMWYMGLCCLSAAGLQVAHKQGVEVSTQNALALMGLGLLLSLIPTALAVLHNSRSRDDVIIDLNKEELICLNCPYGHKKDAKPFKGSLKGLEKVLRQGDTWVVKGVSNSHYYARFVWYDEQRIELAGLASREVADQFVEVLGNLTLKNSRLTTSQQALRDSVKSHADDGGEEKAPEEENWTARWMPAKKDKPKEE